MQVGGGARETRTIVEHLIDWLTDTERGSSTGAAGSGSCGRMRVRHGGWVCGVRESLSGWEGPGRPSVLQHGLVALEHALRHLGSSALQGDLRKAGGQRSDGFKVMFLSTLFKY